MFKLRMLALTGILLIGAAVVPAFAQGPLHKRVNFTINVPFELKTRLLMDTDESWPQKYPLLEGFNIPGEDGWEVISAVTRVRGPNVRGR